mgnify:CR=1 FL=1
MKFSNFILFFSLILVILSCSDIKENNSEQEISKINIEKGKSIENVEKPIIFSIINKSNLIEVNGLKCYWKSDSVFKVIKNDTISLWELDRVLINTNNDKIILNLASEDGSHYEHNGEGEFKDMNFDGQKDFVLYSEENSGSGGSYYNTYVFNSNTKEFKLSKLHSGGLLTLDSIKRTLKSTWRSGVAVRIYNILYFDDKGKTKYRERILTEMFEYIDDKNFKQTTEYQKIINDKVISEKIDTTIYTDN